MNPELVSYIRGELKKGVPWPKIRQRCLGAGWPLGEVDEVLQSLRYTSRFHDRFAVGVVVFGILTFLFFLVLSRWPPLEGENSLKPSCGNGVVDKGETMENCCVDVGCRNNQICEDNVCVQPCKDCEYLDGTACRPYACCIRDDCNDGIPSTLDECINPSTVSAFCSHKQQKCQQCRYIVDGQPVTLNVGEETKIKETLYMRFDGTETLPGGPICITTFFGNFKLSLTPGDQFYREGKDYWYHIKLADVDSGFGQCIYDVEGEVVQVPKSKKFNFLLGIYNVTHTEAGVICEASIGPILGLDGSSNLGVEIRRLLSGGVEISKKKYRISGAEPLGCG